MTPAWAQRQEELLRDCIVSPNVFGPMVDRLGKFVVPCQQALEAGQHHAHRYLAGLLSHLNRKNAETPRRRRVRSRGSGMATVLYPAVVSSGIWLGSARWGERLPFWCSERTDHGHRADVWSPRGW
jgi:hypothetical protein